MARTGHRKTLDFSSGNPVLPLTKLANAAFRLSAKDLNEYHITNQAGMGQPVGEILCNTSAYFTARNFYQNGWTGLGTRAQLMTGGGTTEGYELIIRALAENIQKERRDAGRTINPVIVMPVPTYGFFFENPKRYGIEVVKIERDWRGNGALESKKLLELFRGLEAQDKRVVAYYDCNPHNPLGTVRSRQETIEVARIIQALNRHYEAKDHAERNNKKRGFRRDGIAARARIIDDMIYTGLEHEGSEKAFGFAQLEHEDEFRGIFKDTFTLMGPSKAGLTNLRAGLVIADDKHISELRQIQQTTSYFPPKLSMHALECFYTDKAPYADMRDEYLTRVREQYRFQGLLMKALVNGFADVPQASELDKARMINLVARHDRTSPKAAQAVLENGIDGIRVITTPQAGFFHLLDFTGLKGKVYSNDHVHYKQYHGYNVFDGEEAISHLSESANLRFAYGSWAGLKIEDATVRATFAKPAGEIVAFASRLRWMVAQCTSLKPGQVTSGPDEAALAILRPPGLGPH